jgi:hypothetical protein
MNAIHGYSIRYRPFMGAATALVVNEDAYTTEDAIAQFKVGRPGCKIVQVSPTRAPSDTPHTSEASEDRLRLQIGDALTCRTCRCFTGPQTDHLQRLFRL